MILPVVVHHGEGGWTGPRTLHEIVYGLDRFPSLAPYVPDLELFIDDLAHVTDEALKQRPLERYPKVALWLLRDGRNLDALLEHLPAWSDDIAWLLAADPGGEDIETLARYIITVAGETPFAELRQRIIDISPALERLMTPIEKELIQQGIQQGIQEGTERGRQQALRDAVASLLNTRFGDLPAETRAHVDAGTTEQLNRWLVRILSAQVLADVFAD